MEVAQDQAATIEFYPPVPPTSVTVAVKDSSGGILSSGAATVDSVSTTLATVTDRETATLTSGTGVVPGRRYWIVSAQTSERRALVSVESLTVVGASVDLYPGPQWLPVAGDAFRAARVTYSLGSGATATRDPHCRVEWTVTGTDGAVTVHRTTLSIVRTVFDVETRPEDVRAWLAERYAHRATELDNDPTRYQQIAERATSLVRRRIRESDRWPHLTGDPGAFIECKRLALRIALIDDGIRDGVDDVVTYLDAMIRRLDDETRRGLAACWYDSDDSGSVEVEETRPHWIPIRRG